MCLVDGEDDGFADLAGRVGLGVFEEPFAHHAVTVRGKNSPLQVLYLVVLFLLIDDRRPAIIIEGLGGDVGTNIKDFGHAKEGAFGILDRIHDVVSEGRESRLAAEVVVGITKLAGFQRFRVFPAQLFNVNVLQVRLRCSRETDPSGLEELHNFACVAVD